MKALPTYIAASIALAAVVSCNSEGCFDNQSSIPLAGCYSADGAPVTLSGIVISGVGAPNDSALITANESFNEVYLPMRSTANAVQWCFHYTAEGLDDPAFNDTLSLEYTSMPFFASEECGAMYRYTITRMSHTTHVLDSVAILDSLITNADIESIRLYFRTSTPDNEL